MIEADHFALLTQLLRSEARTLIQEAVRAEFEKFLAKFAIERLEDGRQAVAKNGSLPEREVQTGIGAVEVHSGLVPPYLKKTRGSENLLPWLYFKGISTGDFQEALTSLLGPNAAGLPPATISRLKQQWLVEHDTWSKRGLAKKRYVYGTA